MARSSYLPIAFILGVFALSAILPIGWVASVPLCFFRSVTGWDCPGCGLTRAFIAFFHGDFTGAIRLNGMAPVFILWLAVYLGDHLYRLITGKKPNWFSPQGNKLIAYSFLALMLSQWAFKSYQHYVHGL